jgi:hypothetical protein
MAIYSGKLYDTSFSVPYPYVIQVFYLRSLWKQDRNVRTYDPSVYSMHTCP